MPVPPKFAEYRLAADADKLCRRVGKWDEEEEEEGGPPPPPFSSEYMARGKRENDREDCAMPRKKHTHTERTKFR
jgi:hypothetical protein